MRNLSKPQTAIYEMDRFGGGAVACIAGDLFFENDVSVEDIRNAVNALLRDCDIMRTRIVMQGVTPVQTIDEYTPEIFELLKFKSENDYKMWARKEAQKGVDIFGKLYVFYVVEILGKTGLFLNMHHIIGDAWTMGILGDRLCGYIDGGEVKRIYSYCDYLDAENAYEQSGKYQKDKAFWLDVFDKNPESVYLCEKQSADNSARRSEAVLSPEQSRMIKKFCEDSEVSEFAVFAAAVCAYFFRVTGKNDFYIGTPVLNRTTLAEKNTVGTFINTVPLSVHIGDDDSFCDLCENLGDTAFSAFRHQKYLYSDLLKMLRRERKYSDTLFDVVVSFQNMSLGGKAKINWYHCGAQTESLQIHIDDRNGNGVYHIDYDYQTDKFTAKEIERMHGHICSLLFAAIEP